MHAAVFDLLIGQAFCVLQGVKCVHTYVLYVLGDGNALVGGPQGHVWGCVLATRQAGQMRAAAGSCDGSVASALTDDVDAVLTRGKVIKFGPHVEATIHLCCTAGNGTTLQGNK
jgi:hypothetical protein